MPQGTDDDPFAIPAEQLPPGFADEIKRPPDSPVATRPAATVILARDGAEGVEVLLLRRTRQAGFVPGAWVFPGGRVDAADAAPDLLGRIHGLTPDQAAERLDLVGAEPPAIAYYVACVREAFEETGLLIGTRDGPATPQSVTNPEMAELQRALLAGDVGFGEVLAALGGRLDLDSVGYVAHWVTPIAEPRRYDTRFFLAQVPSESEALLDPREMTDSRWLDPRRALREQGEGTLPMVFPTIKTLEALVDFPTTRAVLDHYESRAIPRILPTLVRTATGVGIQLPKAGEGGTGP